MKQKILKSLLLIATLLAGTNASAYDFEVNGLYYNIISEADRTVYVTSSDGYKYSGDIIIPETVTHENKTYNVTSIGYWAFRDCTGLTSVVIPNSVTSIEVQAFHNCPGLTSIVIPNSVTSIGRRAFKECIGLTSVVISNRITTIGYSTFKECTNLSSVIIPNSVTTIGGCAFYGCDGLTSIVIPNSITTIEASAFGSCDDLTSVVIGSNVTSIGDYVFSGCFSIKEVQCKATTPPSATEELFANEVFEYATLYVPTGSKSSYEAVAPWKNFVNIKENDFAGVEETIDDEIIVSIANGEIVVNGIADATIVEVYTVDGRLAYKGDGTRIPVYQHGIYIVKIAGEIFKVSL